MSDKTGKTELNSTRRQILLGGGSAIALAAFCPVASIPALAQAGAKKPNILVIFGDDIGWWNTSAYNRGQMGYQTPNIDRIADEGAIFTDLYAQQSCTAGRAAFITGQSCFRTGLLKVGLPGAKEGLSEKDPTIAELLKPQGYVTGQFGKNHLGDRNEFLPTVHGFDEFFGNLYHLNAEEEPENPDYPKDPQFLAKFGPRGVLKCKASETDDPTEDPRFGRVGKQTIEDTGPLTRKRMETADEEFLGAAKDFIDRSAKAEKPFFCWFNSTRMHIYTHLKAESKGKTGLGIVADGMAEFDGMVGQLLDQLDELGIAENTIVVWTTDNGAEVFSWPDGGTTPFHGEKNTNWEGGYRVPGMVRWPGVVKPGTEINEIVSHEDWLPTLVAAAGEPDIAAKLLTGYEAAGKTFNVHLDGYNQRKLLDGTGPGARKEYFYWTDDGSLAGLRYDRWKLVFMEQRAEGLDVWQDPLITLRFPKLIDLRADPFEIAQHAAGDYARWRVEHAFALVPAQAYVAKHLQTYVKYPPRQSPGSFSMDHVLEKLQRGGGQ
ncbi:sulfatase-like hydrolase/transferase [Rhizobium leguminosarum bv. viciae]|jgi:arylsulfatase A-like enzyme|uniref:Sulfatase-like hydrolase/transferase n=1 Tax=Rhizobium leguminosarum bv. viciae TaxID=387 RepID=A0A8I2GU03_RHILV|nr:arylsulfatase [Rhizobium leguminosarum]ASR06333.1 arylsulfatase [Rhizobium leguminosarum bv. viciae]MBY5750324.1 arylsulfatase [Rhizobium leguminosarum]MBY5801538.1 arylsulfatase [Rhizobium leguminosarum]NKL96745.1 sulfatase-like hydrolase/transferase [Rhizobium leguminosarum bv. viciae]NKM45339.1 sulfatase-like hydrolase/transferase [Rhizobium leguminosarum bv. viciae]